MNIDEAARLNSKYGTLNYLCHWHEEMQCISQTEGGAK